MLLCSIDYDEKPSFSLVNPLKEKVVPRVTRTCPERGCVRSFHGPKTNGEQDDRDDII